MLTLINLSLSLIHVYFLMRKLSTLGLNTDGLKIFYISNIRSVLSYGAPAWYTLLSDSNKAKLERIQKTAVNVMLPEFSYEEALEALNLPTLNEFLFLLSDSHFSKILNDISHPLHTHIVFNTNSRTSSRSSNAFRPQRCRTVKRQQSFFKFFMMHHSNSFFTSCITF